MTTEENSSSEDQSEERSEPAPPGPIEEEDLDAWPERDPSKDPRWALWIVWIWIGFALSSIAFILVLLVLGWYHD